MSPLKATIFSPRHCPTQKPVGSSAGMPQAKPPAMAENTAPIISRQAVKVVLSSQPPLNTPLDMVLPTKGTRPSSTHQGAGTSPSHQEACTPGPTNLTYQEAEDTWSKRNYDPAAWGKETTNTESYTKWNGREIYSRWRNKIKNQNNNQVETI